MAYPVTGAPASRTAVSHLNHSIRTPVFTRHQIVSAIACGIQTAEFSCATSNVYSFLASRLLNHFLTRAFLLLSPDYVPPSNFTTTATPAPSLLHLSLMSKPQHHCLHRRSFESKPFLLSSLFHLNIINKFLHSSPLTRVHFWVPN